MTDPRQERFLEHTDKEEDLRSPFEIDGDRILYSQAFRRLAGVTQVVWPQEQQVFHTRLTHTLEVTQVARRIAQNLCKRDSKLAAILDPDVVTAAAMAHDLGHPPFAHTGEVALNRLIRRDTRGKEGFEGNAQSFRILTKLAMRKTKQNGLNLTRASLNAMLKYPWLEQDARAKAKNKWGAYRSEVEYFDWVRKGCPDKGEQCIEAAVMEFADDVAFSIHDVLDFQRVNLLPIAELRSDTLVFGEFIEDWTKDHAFGWPRDKDGNEYSPIELATNLRYLEREPGKRIETVFHKWLMEIYCDEQLLARRRPSLYQTELASRLIHRFITGAHVITANGRPKLIRNREATGPENEASNPVKTIENQILFYKRITWHYLIKHPRLTSVQEGQNQIIRTLYDEYKKAIAGKGNADIIPGSMRPYIEMVYSAGGEHKESECRLAADIVSMLTDSEAYAMYWRMTGIKMPGITDISIW
jgi:dGTPase